MEETYNEIQTVTDEPNCIRNEEHIQPEEGGGSKELSQVTWGNSILAVHYDAKKQKNCVQISYSNSQICFSPGYGLAILNLLCMYTRTDQISKYVVDNESYVFH